MHLIKQDLYLHLDKNWVLLPGWVDYGFQIVGNRFSKDFQQSCSTGWISKRPTASAHLPAQQKVCCHTWSQFRRIVWNGGWGGSGCRKVGKVDTAVMSLAEMGMGEIEMQREDHLNYCGTLISLSGSVVSAGETRISCVGPTCPAAAWDVPETRLKWSWMATAVHVMQAGANPGNKSDNCNLDASCSWLFVPGKWSAEARQVFSRRVTGPGIGIVGESHLDHPVDVWFGPAVRRLAGKPERLALLNRLRDRRLLLEVVQDGGTNEDGVRSGCTPLVLGIAHVLAWKNVNIFVLDWLRIQAVAPEFWSMV